MDPRKEPAYASVVQRWRSNTTTSGPYEDAGVIATDGLTASAVDGPYADVMFASGSHPVIDSVWAMEVMGQAPGESGTSTLGARCADCSGGTPGDDRLSGVGGHPADLRGYAEVGPGLVARAFEDPDPDDQPPGWEDPDEPDFEVEPFEPDQEAELHPQEEQTLENAARCRVFPCPFPWAQGQVVNSAGPHDFFFTRVDAAERVVRLTVRGRTTAGALPSGFFVQVFGVLRSALTEHALCDGLPLAGNGDSERRYVRTIVPIFHRGATVRGTFAYFRNLPRPGDGATSLLGSGFTVPDYQAVIVRLILPDLRAMGDRTQRVNCIVALDRGDGPFPTHADPPCSTWNESAGPLFSSEGPPATLDACAREIARLRAALRMTGRGPWWR